MREKYSAAHFLQMWSDKPKEASPTNHRFGKAVTRKLYTAL